MSRLYVRRQCPPVNFAVERQDVVAYHVPLSVLQQATPEDRRDRCTSTRWSAAVESAAEAAAR